MAEQALVQVRVDNQLKKEVTEIYEELGMDLPTAIRMFLKRSKMMRGIPFETRLPQNVITRAEALSAFEELRRQAADVPEMTLDEINAEISEARKTMKREAE
ncbi:MAG: type II toxin-antitoxin system RelB/DinJ family antitoxin [Candidatus Ornithomonoglobus sp.]